ncbi:hypothetical protein [Flavobacterium sp.]|uniref:hypothetical protein n=1 Tax=Flavobacterium sp. TaxID=239 RepID=UPI0008C85AB5|nr:hypothetical protein [Flavobacterium sp.]OGS63293.1 MAG: hypothetical protein A2X07_04485 [Flavobacteria bacterium GWF1_32_7]HBD27285.1 hypothetical protein [Flavobacterium sp.]
MKKYIQYITVAIITLTFTGCTESDDEFFASKIVTSNELIEVNITGNELNVSCYVPRLLPQDTNPFDIYLTSTSRKMFFNYTLEKKNAGGAWEYITPTSVNTIEGENQIGDYISGIAVLDALDTTYEYETNITLTPGQYRIIVDPEIVTLNAQDAVMVTVKTSTFGIPSNALEFTVN